VQLGDRRRTALVRQFVEIDGEQRRRRPDERPADIVGVDVKNVGRDHVLPAVIFEFVGHRMLPWRGRPSLAPDQTLAGHEDRHNLDYDGS
jgi:hypothetical protein